MRTQLARLRRRRDRLQIGGDTLIAFTANGKEKEPRRAYRRNVSSSMRSSTDTSVNAPR
jgi:hypothetical protein